MILRDKDSINKLIKHLINECDMYLYCCCIFANAINKKEKKRGVHLVIHGIVALKLQIYLQNGQMMHLQQFQYKKVTRRPTFIIITSSQIQKQAMQNKIKLQHQNQSFLAHLHKLSIDGEDAPASWNSGHWDQSQNAKCITYFQFNKAHLHSKLKMKENKFFKQMSIFIQTRSPIQCRSQCQKLLRKHKTFYHVINNFKAEYGHQKFEQEYSQHSMNPLIRFKGSLEMNSLDKQLDQSKQIEIQTQKSYLLKKSKKIIKNSIRNQNALNDNDFPFLRDGWWL